MMNGGESLNNSEADEDSLEKEGKGSVADAMALPASTIVTWDGTDDPEHPFNWSNSRKLSMATIISLGQLVCLMTTSIVAPALPQIATDLGLGDSETQVSFSISVLGQAFGSLIVGPLSEVFGRKPLWVNCTLFYILWNSLCPVGKSKSVLITGRFLGGIGAYGGTILSGPIMADMYPSKDRGKSLAIASLFPYLGPAIGPIVGGLVSQHVSWPWLFWVMSIFSSAILVCGMFIIRESFKPILLQRKAVRLRGHAQMAVLNGERSFKFLLSKIMTSLYRPVLLLTRRPVIQLLALLIALAYGTYVLILSFFARVFIEQYGQSATSSSLQYIAIALGITLSTQSGGRLMDVIYARLHSRQPEGASALPEFRVPLMLIGVLILPAGLFLLGWCAQGHIHWIMVDIGAMIFAAGDFLTIQAAQAYILDEFPAYAASAAAASRTISNVFGFSFPLFAPQLYDRLGYGWGNTLLAFVWIVVALPISVALWFWGDRIRSVGRDKEDVEEA